MKQYLFIIQESEYSLDLQIFIYIIEEENIIYIILKYFNQKVYRIFQKEH